MGLMEDGKEEKKNRKLYDFALSRYSDSQRKKATFTCLPQNPNDSC